MHWRLPKAVPNSGRRYPPRFNHSSASCRTAFPEKNAAMDQLVERLARILGRPVLNQTGVQGNFDFLIDYPPDDAATDETVLLLGAIQDQTGLKLETQPGSVEVIVIDRAEKPSGN
jgi:uncharacterized protein (TIGR03435 family)